jgi:hypothetical protein
MPIPMEIPAHLLQGVLNGAFIRIGCTVREVATGQIVAHLKELSGFSKLLCEFPFNPLLGGADTLLQFGQWMDTHSQLKHMQGLLQKLQLVSTVGAVASVAGLGVSVAGFALVMRRLARLEQNLNHGLDKIRVEVERLHHRMDMLEMAELRTAGERLAAADFTMRKERQEDLLQDADRTFQKYRNYYHSLIVDLKPVGRTELTLPQVRELIGRYIACGVAELDANFLLGDYQQWHFRHANICAQMKAIGAYDDRIVFADRIAALGLATQRQQQTIRDQMLLTREFCTENQDRMETSAEEVRWVEQQGMSPRDYSRELQAASSRGIVFVPHEPRTSPQSTSL